MGNVCGPHAAALGATATTAYQRAPARRSLHTSLCPATQLARWHSLLHQRSGPPQPEHFWSGPPPGGAAAPQAEHLPVRGSVLTTTPGDSRSRAPGGLISAWSAARACS
jgi:hypothetical protein